MACNRFHKAAKDGLLDMLKDATRKEVNSKDDDSMTPVLWAAFEGRLDALRLLCGRGGDPDKCDQFGNTALHLSAAKGHLQCVDFLVKFGVNIYALDIDRHSAKDLAAINNRDDILRYLDAATAKFETNEKKKARVLKDLAEKNCDKRIREYMQQLKVLDPSSGNKSTNMLSTLKQKIWSSQGNLHKPWKDSSNTDSRSSTKFSELTANRSDNFTNRIDTEQKKCIAHIRNYDTCVENTGSNIDDLDDESNRRTVTLLNGLPCSSEVLYVGPFSSNDDESKCGKVVDAFKFEDTTNDNTCYDISKLDFGTLSRSYSQPDFLTDSHSSAEVKKEIIKRPEGIFGRPTLGSIAFRRSVTAALTQLHPESCSLDMVSNSGITRNNSMVMKSRSNKSKNFPDLSDSDSDAGDGYSEVDQNVGGSPIQRFLMVWGLDEYLPVFQKQQIDLDTLMLLTESDLKSLGLPLGPFRKLAFAVQERRNVLASPGPMRDSYL